MSTPEGAPAADPNFAGLTPPEIDVQIVTLMRGLARVRVGLTRRGIAPLAGQAQSAVVAATEQEIRADLAPLVAEQKRRGYTRHFVPTPAGGAGPRQQPMRAAHPESRCRVAALAASGMTPAELVAILGPVPCQQCYPELPDHREPIRRTQAMEMLEAIAAYRRPA
jgi:hypothetical protein